MSKAKHNGHLRPDPKNARRHSERNRALIRQSLEAVGGFRSIAVDGSNVIRAGNGVFEQAQELGLKVRVVDAKRNELIAVRRKDLRGKEAIRAAALDNLAADSSAFDYDAEILAEIARDDELIAQLAREEKAIAALLGLGEQQTYSRNIEAPIYTPKGPKPEVSQLFDDSKTKTLVTDIDRSELPEAEKAFLRIAAQRHTVLNFKRIAEYYAHSERSVQKLMEDSALVIIDFNRAIELGYVKLAEAIAAQYNVDYPDA